MQVLRVSLVNNRLRLVGINGWLLRRLQVHHDETELPQLSQQSLLPLGQRGRPAGRGRLPHRHPGLPGRAGHSDPPVGRVPPWGRRHVYGSTGERLRRDGDFPSVRLQRPGAVVTHLQEHVVHEHPWNDDSSVPYKGRHSPKRLDGVVGWRDAVRHGFRQRRATDECHLHRGDEWLPCKLSSVLSWDGWISWQITDMDM